MRNGSIAPFLEVRAQVVASFAAKGMLLPDDRVRIIAIGLDPVGVARLEFDVRFPTAFALSLLPYSLRCVSPALSSFILLCV